MAHISAWLLGFCLVLGALGPALGCSSAGRTGVKNRLILLTAFEPFAGRHENLSYDVAREIEKRQAELGEGVQVRVCLLPVVYDAGAAQAERCYAELAGKPELVLSLGEGGCRMSVETAATNYDHAPELADNQGVLRTKTRILRGGVNRIGFTLPVAEMFCEIEKPDDRRVELSVSPGNFVCNNAAYLLAGHFRERRMPYGFVHVPPMKCDPAVRDVARNGALLVRMLKRALQGPALALISTPSTSAEVQARLKELGNTSFDSQKKACHRAFLETLVLKYSSTKIKGLEL